MAQVLARWSRLDLCINCAGIAFSKPFTETGFAEWRRVMSVSLDGVFLGTRQAMNGMKTCGGGCSIIIHK